MHLALLPFVLWLLSGRLYRTHLTDLTWKSRSLTFWLQCRTNWRSAPALFVIIIMCFFEDTSQSSCASCASCASKEGSSSLARWVMIMCIMWMLAKNMLLALKSCEYPNLVHFHVCTFEMWIMFWEQESSDWSCCSCHLVLLRKLSNSRLPVVCLSRGLLWFSLLDMQPDMVHSDRRIGSLDLIGAAKEHVTLSLSCVFDQSWTMFKSNGTSVGKF